MDFFLKIMKYVWASWAGRKPTGELLILGSNTKKIAGYGCAVTFSSMRMEWSAAHVTYDLRHKEFEPSFCHG